MYPDHWNTSYRYSPKGVRDQQRQKLYNAERAAGLVKSEYDEGVPDPELRTLSQVSTYLTEVQKTPWFFQRFGRPRQIELTDGRGARRAAAMGYGSAIRLPVWARQKSVVLHELAHVLCNKGAPHGPEYARTYLELVGKYLGAEEGKKLRAAFREHRVKVGPPLTVRSLDEPRAYRLTLPTGLVMKLEERTTAEERDAFVADVLEAALKKRRKV